MNEKSKIKTLKYVSLQVKLTSTLLLIQTHLELDWCQAKYLNFTIKSELTKAAFDHNAPPRWCSEVPPEHGGDARLAALFPMFVIVLRAADEEAIFAFFFVPALILISTDGV